MAAIKVASVFNPRRGLAVNPTGETYPNTGCIDDTSLLMGDQFAGVPNAETVFEPSAPESDPKRSLPGGILDISMCTQIALIVEFIKDTLTSVDIIPMFGFNVGSVSGFYKRGSFSIAAGIVTVTPLIYRFTADYTGIIVINNPGLPFLRLSTASVGAVGASTLVVSALRSAGGTGNMLAG